MLNFKNSYNSISPFQQINFLNKEEIYQIASNLKSIPYLEGSTPAGEVCPISSTTIRKSSVKWIPFKEEWEWLYNKLSSQVNLVNSQLWRFNLKQSFESIQYTEYLEKDKGEYNWHIDTGEGPSSHRKISITIQLSDPDEYEGGELQLFTPNSFQNSDSLTSLPYISADKGLGNAVFFPSFIVHRVTPITKGIRRSLVLWVGDSHFK